MYRPQFTFLYAALGILSLLVFALTCADSTGPDRERAAVLAEMEGYIPKDLDDCMLTLEKVLSHEVIEYFKTATEEDIGRQHFGLGMWIRNNWKLWSDSHLAEWFKGYGVVFPDEMSSIILLSFYRHINDQPIRFDEQTEIHQKYLNLAED